MRAASILLVLVMAIAGIGYYFVKVDRIQNHMKLGLDLKGGVHMVLEGVDSDLGEVTSEKLDAAMHIIEKRVNGLGVSEPIIQKDASKNRIIVEIAGETDTERARQLLGTTAVLKFVGPDGSTVLEGKDIAEAGVASNRQTGGGYVVTLKLKGEGPQKFADATRKFIGQPIAIMLDDQQISAPVVQNEITNGEAIITGDFTVEKARDLAQLINGGALPIKLELKENRVVSATLGADSLAKSAKAGVIGLSAVVLFMLVVYGIPGLMANIALVLYVMLTLGFLISIDAVFTLPGLAGLLLSMGMAVDANIIIFERIREELRKGKGLRSGIQAGFHRAYAAIVDGQVTTAIAGVVLWFLGTQSIKGFALTLVVGLILSMFTAITVTRWLINLCVNTGWFDKRLFGVKEVATR
jgi:preprotein translocase subunit SecD